MMWMRVFLGFIALIVIQVLITPARYTLSSTQAAPMAATVPIVGMSGCAARGCHGGLVAPDAPTTSANAFSRWITRDRHAQAYRVLEKELAAHIMRNLTPRDQPVPAATDDVRCLACHVTPELAALPAEVRHKQRHLLEEGVSCEACHGGAKDWTGPHTTWSTPTENPKPRRPLYEDAGMVWLNSPESRAQSCVGCHVGAIDPTGKRPPQEVTHDLIAAGHPRLTFEFHTYLKAMPPHWVEVDRSQTGTAPARPAHSALTEWQAGQVVCADGALDLLQARARRAQSGQNQDWPELSEYDCFACHHDLQPASWRQKLGAEPGRKVGQLPWNRWAWSYPMQRWTNTEAAHRELVQVMVSGSPAPKRVIAAAEQLSAAINQKMPVPAPLSDAELQRLTWDDAAQLYFALVAVRDANPDAIDATALPKLRQRLALTQQVPAANSPRRFRVDADFPPPEALFQGVWKREK